MNDMVPVRTDGVTEVPAHNVTPASLPSTTIAQQPLATPISRRTLIVGGAGTLAVGIPTYMSMSAPRQVHSAMMRLDNVRNNKGEPIDHIGFCLDHRIAFKKDSPDPQSADTEQRIDVSVNANSLKPEGHEALVLSPDLMIQANDPDAPKSKTNIGGHNISIANNAADVFIPFQLLENAQSATFGYNAAGKLTLTIKSLPVEIPLTAAQQISDAATAAQRATTCAAARTRNEIRQYVPDVISGILPDSMTGPSDESSCTPLAPREKRYATTTSAITLEGATRTNLPNIHLYDTRRYNSDYHLAGDFRIEADNLHKRIIQGNGNLLASNLTGKNNAEMITLAPTRRFNEPKLQHCFEATRLGNDTEYSNELSEQVASFTRDLDTNPEGLNARERDALNMATIFKEHEFTLTQRGGRLFDEVVGNTPTR